MVGNPTFQTQTQYVAKFGKQFDWKDIKEATKRDQVHCISVQPTTNFTEAMMAMNDSFSFSGRVPPMIDIQLAPSGLMGDAINPPHPHGYTSVFYIPENYGGAVCLEVSVRQYLYSQDSFDAMKFVGVKMDSLNEKKTEDTTKTKDEKMEKFLQQD